MPCNSKVYHATVASCTFIVVIVIAAAAVTGGERPHPRGQAVETWQSRGTAGKMSSIDFDEVLVHVGERGRYQNLMYYLLCIPATLPAAFLAFSQVSADTVPFIAWCITCGTGGLLGFPEITAETEKLIQLRDRETTEFNWRAMRFLSV